MQGPSLRAAGAPAATEAAGAPAHGVSTILVAFRFWKSW
jgi:hypothetical protein